MASQGTGSARHLCHPGMLEDLPPLEGSSAGRSSTSIFPDTIPQCPVGEEELWGPYSLTATAGQLAAKGTKWDKQLAALEKFKTKPPLSSHGRVSKVGPTSMELMMRSLDEYVGYAQKHHGVSPSMDLVMQPNMFCKFMAFKLATWYCTGTLETHLTPQPQTVSLNLGP